MYVYYDKENIIRQISSSKIEKSILKYFEVNNNVNWMDIIGKKIPQNMISNQIKDTKDIRVAIVCNWNDKCGISTYTNNLVRSMLPKVGNIKIFSEFVSDPYLENKIDVEHEECWTRGQNLLPLSKNILSWKPDYIIVQHEYGIFPNAFRFMQFMQSINHIPYMVMMHSVYKHLDKITYAETINNIGVHSKEAMALLREHGNSSTITVIPHGCSTYSETSEIWNNMVSPYTIMQFGFGFQYKGVDRVLRAISHLKNTDPKFKDILYFYLCSTNNHNSTTNNDYFNYLMDLAKELNIIDNIAIVQKYQTNKSLNRYLRIAKLVVFPYLVNDENTVYGASGAIRVAMGHNKPVIASDSHLFDDFEGILPRPKDHLELAKEIDEIFSNNKYKQDIIDKSIKYINDNSWSKSVDLYLDFYKKIIGGA